MRTLEGNTWPVREALRRLGARWLAYEQRWEINDDYYAAACELIRTGVEDMAARRFHTLEEYARPEPVAVRQTVLTRYPITDDERELCRLEALEMEEQHGAIRAYDSGVRLRSSRLRAP